MTLSEAEFNEELGMKMQPQGTSHLSFRLKVTYNSRCVTHYMLRSITRCGYPSQTSDIPVKPGTFQDCILGGGGGDPPQAEVAWSAHSFSSGDGTAFTDHGSTWMKLSLQSK